MFGVWLVADMNVLIHPRRNGAMVVSKGHTFRQWNVVENVNSDRFGPDQDGKRVKTDSLSRLVTERRRHDGLHRA